MARGKTKPEKETTGGGMPAPDRSSDRNDFLQYTDVGKKIGDRGKVTFLGEKGRRIRSQYGEQYVFPVKVNGRAFDWAIRVDSGNHFRLADRFGTKPPRGVVTVEIDEFSDNLYIKILD